MFVDKAALKQAQEDHAARVAEDEKLHAKLAKDLKRDSDAHDAEIKSSKLYVDLDADEGPTPPGASEPPAGTTKATK